MKIQFTFLFYFLLIYSISSQSKQDYIWHFGQDQISSEEGVQASQINFNDSIVVPRLREGGLEFDRNNASICDENGNLLIYTNGCAVANRLGQVMPNGDSINAGEFFDLQWNGDCTRGYTGRQDIMILPRSGNSNEYYILHKPREFQANNKFLKYSIVDISLDNGLGDVVEKNKIYFEGHILSSYFTAISHSNQVDYWILQPKRDDNIYYRFLLTSNGIETQDSLRIGNVFNDNASAAGDVKFSPDGTKYAIFNAIDGIQLFDFDRVNGELSNHRHYTTDANVDRFTSIEFSPNSRFLYFMDQLNLWQIDLENIDPQSSIVLIEENNGTQDPFSTTFFLSTLAPDCKIYIRGGNGANSFHRINKPNEKGVACDFRQNSIRFPLITARGGFPNFPRFRVDEEEKCDPGLTSNIESIGWEVRDMSIYPNPARDYVQLTIPDQNRGRLLIYDTQGQQLIDRSLELHGLSPNTVEVSTLASGNYLIEFIPFDRKDRIFYQGRLQVVR